MRCHPAVARICQPLTLGSLTCPCSVEIDRGEFRDHALAVRCGNTAGVAAAIMCRGSCRAAGVFVPRTAYRSAGRRRDPAASGIAQPLSLQLPTLERACLYLALAPIDCLLTLLGTVATGRHDQGQAQRCQDHPEISHVRPSFLGVACPGKRYHGARLRYRRELTRARHSDEPKYSALSSCRTYPSPIPSTGFFVLPARTFCSICWPRPASTLFQ